MNTVRTVRGSLAASVAVARERLQRGPQHVLAALLVQALVLLVVGRLMPGVLVADIVAALLTVAVLALLNALVRPLLVLLTLPLTVASFGLASLLINASMIVIAAPLVPGLEVHGFLPAFSLAILLTVATTIVNVLLSVDEDDTFYAELARRIARGTAGERAGDGPRPTGLVIVQVDGLAAPILRNAIRVGLVPRMAAWVRSGGYRLAEWDCPPPAQTSASQAGILHGDADGIPAFRWYEKSTGRLLVSNRPADAAEIERRVSNGQGLLSRGGASVGNLLSGDARHTAFTMSRMTDPVGTLDVDAFQLYFVDPGAFVRTVALTLGEAVKELLEALRQRRQDIQPRVHRGAVFAFLRAATNVVLRDLNTTVVVRAMTVGVPVIYVDYVDYDEVAHHAGPERLESLRTLGGVDRVIGSLERAAAGAGRDYRFVILSDHGQSQGATFRDRYGRTLEALIRDLASGAPDVLAATGRSESFGPVNALLNELTQRPGVAGRASERALRGQMRGGSVELVPRDERLADAEVAEAEVVVAASGNLANVYFTADRERSTAGSIEERHPGLLAGLASHPGIGFVMVRADTGGSIVLGGEGVHHLEDGRVVGKDPLAPFGPRAADHLRRLDGFSDIGDLVINSMYDPVLDEVAAFEELVGSHGGMGGPQNRPFLLHPADLPLDVAPLVGSPAVHRQLQRWIERLDVQDEPEADQAGAPTPQPRGLGIVVAYLVLLSSLLLIGGVGTLAVVLAGGAASLPEEVGRVPGVVALVVACMGLFGLATAVGLWRRQRWAWLAALAIQGIAVLQLLFALASGGLHGVVSYGVVGAVAALGLFFYLTRPHVAAAFGAGAPARPGRR